MDDCLPCCRLCTIKTLDIVVRCRAPTGGATSLAIGFGSRLSCCGFDLLEFGIDGFSGAKEPLFWRLAFECLMWHHLIVLLHVDRDAGLKRGERIKALLKQASVLH